MRILALLAALLLIATGCDNNAPRATASAMPAPQLAVSRDGDVTIRASVIQTAMLNESVVQRYGITRADNRIMLLVGVRKGPQAQETSIPAQITATATDLGGHRHVIEMRELRSGNLLDYVGTFEIALPDTLRFDLRIVRKNGAASTMQFSRDFYP